jgi:NAD+ synthase (glutamine-hydrolysing)
MNQMGFFRVAAAVPAVKPASISDNADAIIRSFTKACEMSADLVLFPELSVTGYTCADLFLQSLLLEEAERQAVRIIEETSARGSILIFGMPLSRRGRVFNVAVIVRGGTEILGVVPKTYIPDSREYYENRWFSSADDADFSQVELAGQTVPFGTDIVFHHEEDRRMSFAVEICEDLWSPIPPSSRHAIAGAQMLFNLSASNELVGKADYRRSVVLQQSARCLAGYVYTSAGPGESTTDTVFGGHALIAENGRLLAESERFPTGAEITYSDLDLDLLDHERRVSRTFGPAARRETAEREYRTVPFGGRLKGPGLQGYTLLRPVDSHPFVPSDPTERDMRCREISSIQATALATRLERTGIKNAVIGISGGLDSTLALLVTARAFERQALPLENIEAITMPGFGTTGRTLGNVEKLCSGLNIPLETIDIRRACEQQMSDLKHSGEPNDVAYENVQARYRTSILMNRANMNGGLVIGTGDLSELALGWCTYNGDHMSMYAVNTGVPKTLVRYLVRWAAETWAPESVKPILEDILDTPISPELLPPGADGEIEQKTEEKIGPYELHDFFLFHAIRHGFGPAKVRTMAEKAFEGVYDKPLIDRWLRVFYQRFFSQQFKRSCLPDGPKVGTIALSPRGDWRMPSDGDVSTWLADLEQEGNK